MVQFEPGKVSLDDLESLYRHSTHFQIHPGAYPRIADSVGTLSRRIGEGETIYGVNTGFGKLASVRINGDSLALLQKNLVRSHAAGIGEPLPANIVRLMMALKCISLARGASGVRVELVDRIQQVYSAGIIPVIP
ncbi:MAG TPA: histidine ammonia-lyase, partial [Hyphomonas sp.]|nr:histidine ammonia-lyase [Hyphomonas sp.]